MFKVLHLIDYIRSNKYPHIHIYVLLFKNTSVATHASIFDTAYFHTPSTVQGVHVSDAAWGCEKERRQGRRYSGQTAWSSTEQTDEAQPWASASTVNTQKLVSHGAFGETCSRSGFRLSLTCLQISVYVIPASWRQTGLDPYCEKSIWLVTGVFWPRVYVNWALRKTLPYHNGVCMTVCLWLFTKAGVGRETQPQEFALTESEIEA